MLIFLLLLLLLMLLLWPFLLFLITLYLVRVDKSYSKAVDFVVFVVVVVAVCCCFRRECCSKAHRGCCGVCVVMGWVGKGLARYFHVQPNYCAEVVLRCVVVGIVTMIAAPKSFAFMDGAFI